MPRTSKQTSSGLRNTKEITALATLIAVAFICSGTVTPVLGASPARTNTVALGNSTPYGVMIPASAMATGNQTSPSSGNQTSTESGNQTTTPEGNQSSSSSGNETLVVLPIYMGSGNQTSGNQTSTATGNLTMNSGNYTGGIRPIYVVAPRPVKNSSQFNWGVPMVEVIVTSAAAIAAVGITVAVLLRRRSPQ